MTFRKIGLHIFIVVVLVLTAACLPQTEAGPATAEADVVAEIGAAADRFTDQKIVLRFANWASAEQSTRDNIDKVIADFEAAHPQTTIENIPIPFDQVRQQLITMSAGGNPPDIVQLSGPWSQELGPLGVLRDLNELMTPAQQADNWAGGLEAGSYEGKLYAIPFGLSPHGLWYNKKILAEAGYNAPPQTMDELNNMMAVLRQTLPAEVYPIGIGTTTIDYTLTGFWPWLLTFNARPMYNGDMNFNTPQTRQAFEWLQMIAQNDYTPLGQQIKEERELMAKGQVVMKLDGPYMVGILRKLNPELAGNAFYDTFGVTTVPVGAVDHPITLADIHQLGISAQTEHPDIAWEFVQHLTSSDIAIEEYFIPLGMIPPLKSTISQTHPEAFQDPVSQAYINDIIPSMVGGPFNPQYGAAQQFIIQGMQEVALSNADVSQTLDDITKNLQLLYGGEQ